MGFGASSPDGPSISGRRNSGVAGEYSLEMMFGIADRSSKVCKSARFFCRFDQPNCAGDGLTVTAYLIGLATHA